MTSLSLRRIAASLGLFLAAVPQAPATPFTMTVPGTGISLPSAYPQAGGVAMVMVGANGNIYYQFSNPAGAFVGYSGSGTPVAFRGNPFTINNPIALNCGASSCATYFGGSIQQMYVRFTANDGDTAAGNFDFNDISLRMNGFDVGNWSTIQTEITNVAGTTSGGFQTGFGDGTHATGWFSTTNAALLSNVLTTGSVTTQVFDRDPNDNFWDFTQGSNLSNTALRTVAPGYTLDKTANVASFTAVGQIITYRYVIENIGSVTINSIAVVDDKLSGITCDRTSLPAVSFGQTPNRATCTGSYAVTQADFDQRRVTNIARASGTPEFGVLGSLSDTVTVTGPALSPSMSLTKSSTLTAFGAAGTSVPYALSVRNTGNATLSNVVVSDPRLPGLSCSVASLAPGATQSCSGSYTVTQADVDAFAAGTRLQNTASARANDPTGAAVNASASLSLPGPAANVAISLDKTTTAANYSAVGAVVPYRFAVTNTGNVTWPAAPVISDDRASVTCPAGSVAPGATVNCTANYSVTQADLDVGSLTNTATASASVNGVTQSATDQVTIPAQRTTRLLLDKRLAAGSATSFDDAGIVLSYEYVLTNAGNVTLNAPAVSDDRASVSCPATPIAPGASVTCTASTTTTQAMLNAGGLTNTATARARPASASADISSTSDSVTVPAVRSPALTMAKTGPNVTPGNYRVGRTITYSYLVTNSGNVDLAGPVTVADNRIGTFTCAAGPLARGASVTCTRSYTLTSTDIRNGSVTNTATASANGTSSPADSVTISPTVSPGLSLVKSTAVTSVDALGDSITYSFQIENTGDNQIILPGQPVTVADPRVPSVDCSAQPAVLSPGERFTCTGTRSGITQAELDAGQVSNTAIASYNLTAAVPVRSNASIVTVPVDEQAGVSLTKTGPAQFDAVGEALSYVFSVQNTGNVTLSQAVVTDPRLPALSCTLGPIAPGASAGCAASYVVTQADMDAGQIPNTATVRAQTLTGGAVSATDGHLSLVNPASAIKSATLDKVADRASFAAVGDVITYTMTLRNTGTQTLRNITVSDAMLPGWSCPILALAPGAASSACSFSHSVTQAEVDAGQIVNSASAASPDFPTLTASVTTPGPVRSASFSLAKSASRSAYAAVGETITFTMTLRNTGNVTLTDLRVSDPFFAPALSCTIASLAPGAQDAACSGSHVVTQADIDAGSLTNTASATASAPAGVTAPAGRSSSVTVQGPSPAPSVQIVKTPGAGSFAGAGSSLSYDFVVSNTGNVTLSGLSVSDTALGFTCALDNLAPGASTGSCSGGSPALRATRVMTQADVDRGSYANTAAVSGTSLVGGIAVGDTDEAVVTGPVQNPAISLAKSSPTADFDAVGDTISYSYLVTNTGNVTLTSGISVSDDRIASVSCPALPSGGIPPGGSLTCTAVHVVSQADLDAGQVTNLAQARTNQPVVPRNPGDPAFVAVTSAPASATVTALPLPALTLDKRIKASSPSSFAAVGDRISYEYVVTNSGNLTTTGPITIADDRIAGSLTCASTPLAPGASVICEQDWSATQAALDDGEVTNTARATTVIGATTVRSNADTATAVALQQPRVAVVKTFAGTSSPGTFNLGDQLTYSIVVSNPGNVTISGPITLTDNLTVPSCPPLAGNALAPGQSLTCSATHSVTANDLALGSATNVVTASGTFNGDPVTSAPDDAIYPVDARPALSLAKAATPAAVTYDSVGDTITYAYTVTNTGNVGLVEDIFVTDDRIPGGPHLCRDNALGAFATGASHSCQLTYSVTQADLDAAAVTNNATASTSYPAAGPGNTLVLSPGAAATVTGQALPGLSVDKTITTSLANAAVGDVVGYAITVTNSGNQTLSGVAASDPRLTGLACRVGPDPAPANVVLAPGGVMACTGSYTVTQADVDAQSLPNTASARGASPQGTTITGSDSISQPLVAADPRLEVTKSLDPVPGPGEVFAGPGQPLRFVVRVRNTGNVTLTGTTVTDDLVAGSCSVGRLAPGEEDSSCVFTYVTTQADVDRLHGTAPAGFGGLTNTARGVAQPAHPGAPTIEDSGSVFVEGPAHQRGLALAKTALSTGFDGAGDVLRYRFTVTNVGNVTLSGVPVIADDRIGSFACGTMPPAGLAPQASLSCEADYIVTQADVDAGQVTNVATVTSAEVPTVGPLASGTARVDGARSPAMAGRRATAPPAPAAAGPRVGPLASGTARVDGARSPSMAVTKTASITSGARAGDTITYSYAVANTGNVTLQDVTLADAHVSAAGTTALAIDGDQVSVDGGAAGDSTDGRPAGVWGVLRPGDTLRFSAAYVVTQADIDAGNALTNRVTVTSVSPPGTTAPVQTADASVAVVAPVGAMQVLKTASTSGLTAPPRAGQSVAWTVTVANTGNVTLTAPTLVDRLTNAAGSVLTPAPTLTRGSGDDGDNRLEVGETWTYTGTTVLTQAMVNSGAILNSVTASSRTPRGVAVSDVSDHGAGSGSSPTVVSLPRVSSMTVVKTSTIALGTNGRADAGDVVTYSYVVANTGNTTLLDIAVSETSFNGSGTRPVPARISGGALLGGAPTIRDLNPATSMTFRAGYVLTQADVDRGSISNQATGTGIPPTGGTVSDLSGTAAANNNPTVRTLPPVRALDVQKRAITSALSSPVRAGDVLSWTITARNTGNVSLSGPALTDSQTDFAAVAQPLTSGPTLVSGDNGDGIMQPGEAWVYAASTSLTQAMVDAGGLLNTATMQATAPVGVAVSDISDNDGTGASDPTQVPFPAAPLLTLDKRLAAGSEPSFDAVGDVLTYEFLVTNAGNVTLSGAMSITDPLITGAGGMISCPPGPLAPMASLTCTGSYTVVQADLDLGRVDNSASALLGATGSAPDSLTVPAVQRRSMTVAKQARPFPPASFVVGATVTYDYTVTNTGNVTITDPITLADNRIPGPITCPAGALAPQAQRVCTASYTVTADDVNLGSVTNVASASDGTTTSPATSATIPDGATPALSISKSLADGAPYDAVGDVLTYRYEVRNTGTAAFAAPVTVIDDKITGGPIPCFAPTPGDPDFVAGEVVVCTAQYVVIQADLDQGEVVNTAYARTTRVAGTVEVVSPPDSVTAPAAPAPAISLSKAARPASVAQVGESVTFDLVARNSGNQTLTGVVVSDPMLPGLSCSIAVLAPQAELACSANYTVTQADVDRGSLVNTAGVTAVSPQGTAVSATASRPVTMPTPAPSLLMLKSASPSPFGAVGSDVVFGFSVENTGNVTLRDLVIGDALAPGYSCTIPVLAPGATDSACQVTLPVQQGWIDAAEVVNSATITGRDPFDTPVTGTAQVVVPGPAQLPSLEAEKVIETAGAAVGEEVVWLVRVVNTGNVTLSQLSLADSLTRLDGSEVAPPPAAALQGGDADGDNRLDVGESFVFALRHRLTQADLDAGGLSNSVIARAEGPLGQAVQDIADNGDDSDGNTTDDPTVLVLDPPAGLTVTKTVASQSGVAVGDVISWSIRVENTGQLTLRGLTPTDRLTRMDGTPVATAAPVRISGADALAPGGVQLWSLSHSITQADIDAGGLSNTVLVRATRPNGDPVEDVSDDGDNGDGNTTDDPTETPIARTPLLEVVKTVVSVGRAPGEMVEFEIAARNRGNVTLTDLVPSDTMTRGDGTPVAPVSVSFAANDGASPPSAEGSLLPGETARWRVQYRLTQEDIDARSLRNQAVVAGRAPGGGAISDLSDDDGIGTSDPTVAPINTTAGLQLVKSVVSQQMLFPTVHRVTFRIEATNTGNLTLRDVQIADALTGFLAPASLALPDYPLVVSLSGFAEGSANPAYDGGAEADLLSGSGGVLAPGATGRVDLTLVYSTRAGVPAGQNRASAAARELGAGVVSNPVGLTGADADGDGVPDTLESCGPGDDRDGDGICDAQDFDPTGTFYCEEDGRILSGGRISVSDELGRSDAVILLRDGSDGRFQFFVTRAGTYTMAVSYPPEGSASVTRLPVGSIDLTSLLPANPASLGSGENGATGRLSDFGAGANRFSLVFVIEAGDPHVINVNIPLRNCASSDGVQVTKLADRSTAVNGESVGFTLTYANNSSARLEAARLVDQLPQGMVYVPGSAVVNGLAREPSVSGSRLVFSPIDMPVGANVTLRFNARITGQVPGTLTNQAWLEDSAGLRRSGIASASVRVQPEAVFQCADVIGKVFDDRNGNGVQDGPGQMTMIDPKDESRLDNGKLAAPTRAERLVQKEGEPGLGGVRLATVNGLVITTDDFGRFHVPCAALPAEIGQNFLLKLDARSLPRGYRLTTENPRVLRLTPGKIAKMNFGASLAVPVEIDLSARAFDGAEVGAELSLALKQLVLAQGDRPIAVTLIYHQGGKEDEALALQRLTAAERLLKRVWSQERDGSLSVDRSIRKGE